MMESTLLENFAQDNRTVFNEMLSLLDRGQRWEKVIQHLQFYRIPIHFNEVFLQKVQGSRAPSQVLLGNLISRTISVGHLIEILDECGFYDISSLLTGKRKLEIREQPGSKDQIIHFQPGDDLKLECFGSGYPPPNYQWYLENSPIPGANDPFFHQANFQENNEGEYFCVLSHIQDGEVNEVTSNSVICQLLESPPVVSPLQQELVTSIGKEIILKAAGFFTSKTKFQWIRGNTILEDQKSNVLQIRESQETHQGKYKCLVSNSAGEAYTSECIVKVHPINRASAKIALLIGNQKYRRNYVELKTPHNDVVELAKILRALDFHVITLIDLELAEMLNVVKWFCDILPPGAYGVFYYVGHGFEMYNNKFMMPVDCPNSNEFLMSDCLCDQFLIQMAMKKQPAFLVFILDMCLKIPNREHNRKIYEEKTPSFEYDNTSKLLLAYATSSHQNAHEKVQTTNGMYLECLKKYLPRDQSLVVLLEKAHNEFSQQGMGAKQKPFLAFDSLCLQLKLTDPVVGGVKLDPKVYSSYLINEKCDLLFEKEDLRSVMEVRPHQEFISNAIDLVFLRSFAEKWSVSPDVSPEFLSHDHIWTVNERGEKILTLFNLQKVKSSIVISLRIHLKSPRERELRMVDHYQIDLGSPLICGVNLWFQSQH